MHTYTLTQTYLRYHNLDLGQFSDPSDNIKTYMKTFRLRKLYLFFKNVTPC
jgi:hypothetical protein